MVPILTGVVPFGAVMGTVSADAGTTLVQSTGMNFLAYAGAAQLAATDLMTKHTPILVVVVTGLIINLRFLLYSAAMAPHLRHEGFWTKAISAYFLTDQAYALMSSQQDRLKSSRDIVSFYLGASVCMTIAWHSSVLAGFLFGNFAPKSWALDFAVPLSFIVLLVPTLRNRKYVAVAAVSAMASGLFRHFPFKLGLISAVAVAMGVAIVLTRRNARAS